MLNPELKLNPKVFDEDVEQRPIRDGYGEALIELGKKNPNIVVLTADLAESTRVHKFAERFPERFIECGVAEQNMAGIAAGLGISGKIAFISSYATFSPGKNWETIRTTIIYNDANVKIAGHHSGIVTGPDGATHQATEDIAIMRCLPNIRIISPCDYWEAKKATLYSAEVYGPFYIRFVRDKTPVITTEETPFRFGKIEEFWIPRTECEQYTNNTRTDIPRTECEQNANNTRTDIPRTECEQNANNTRTEENILYKELSYKINGIIFKIKDTLGLGHKENIYKNAFEIELQKENIPYEKEKFIDVFYEDKLVGSYRPDFIIDDKILIEFKSAKYLSPDFKKQIWYYLKGSNYKLALLINFGEKSVDIERIIYDKARENSSREFASSSHEFAPVAIFSTGHLVYQALLAAKELEEEGIDVYVLNVHTIKPLDIEKIFEVAKKVRGIITLEDHQIYGGLGSAISEVLMNFDLRKQFNLEVVPPIKFLGLQNTFGESGKPNELIQKYGMDKEAVKKAVRAMLS